jgi:hypothetical protein
MPRVYQVFFLGKEKEIVRRERRKGKKHIVYRVGIRIEFRTSIKILLISLVEAEVSREKSH